jgi:predicted GIY-YIG superfamily endonuclease
MKKDKKPNGYWTRERVLFQSKQEINEKSYKTVAEFSKGSPHLYDLTCKHKLIDELELLRKRNPNNYWTKEKVFEKIKFHNIRSQGELKKDYGKIYDAAQRLGILSELGLEREVSENWTKEKLIHLIKEKGYTTVRELRENLTGGAYDKVKKLKLIDELGINKERLATGYWDELTIREEVKRKGYRTKNELQRKSPGAYAAAKTLDIMEDLGFESVGNREKRCIYRYKFGDGYFYVGLTGNTRNRNNQHINGKKSTAVKKHMKKTGLIPEYKELTGYMPKAEAQKKEKEYIELYINQGLKKLNIAKGGALGTPVVKWTFEKAAAEAMKFKTVAEFRKSESRGALFAIYKNNWMSRFNHFIKPVAYRTNEEILKFASTCKDEADFKKKFFGAFASAKRRSILDQLSYGQV